MTVCRSWKSSLSLGRQKLLTRSGYRMAFDHEADDAITLTSTLALTFARYNLQARCKP